MANEERHGSSNTSFPMRSGEDKYSYSRNSHYQKNGADMVKTMMLKEITEKLDLEQCFSSPRLFNVADLGCSIGPNTFFVVQNIIDAVELKHQALGLSKSDLEFQVFFSDQSSNDFNTLFRSLPPERRYFASGVPGTFYGRLFPKASLHFAHCSYAVHWLSKIPKQVLDRNSPAWNRGRIHYRTKEVKEAFAAQFAEDMKSFLEARAEEVVSGGLMALILCGQPSGTDPSKCAIRMLFELLGFSFMDMAKMGLTDEAKVDSFNLPLYFPAKEELEGIIQNNGCFDIEKAEVFHQSRLEAKNHDVQKFILMIRSAFEMLICENFGTQILEQLFQRFTERVTESGILWYSSYSPFIDLFVFLKRKVKK
ncbi:SAM dependent carboxyl methyltransferase [Dillenia turbinata]|uniref:SAM dependent carboxyl methyltransferase n=1 Tax=Dillenia turbinata TaxID=194707 RepID=A0AAN8VH27_9MAGN